jgi:hypothetical protein
MNKYFPISASLMTVAALTLTLTPVLAANVDVGINVGIPGVYVPAPVYVQPQAVYVQPQRVYVEREDECWKCKKDKCKLKKGKKEKHHKDD